MNPFEFEHKVRKMDNLVYVAPVITLAEARKRALEALDRVEERRRKVRDEETRRWKLLDAIS